MSGNTCLKLMTLLSAAAGSILISNAALGAPIDAKLKKAVEAGFEDVLSDPYSAKYTFDQMTMKGQSVGVVCGTVNAKNKLGAYAGKRAYSAVFLKDTDGIYHAEPKVWDEGVTLADLASVCGKQ